MIYQDGYTVIQRLAVSIPRAHGLDHKVRDPGCVCREPRLMRNDSVLEGPTKAAMPMILSRKETMMWRPSGQSARVGLPKHLRKN